MIVAVDGPAASGKGTIASRLARHLGLPHLDTGLLYRAVGRAWLLYEDAPDSTRRAVELARHLDVDSIEPHALSAAGIGQAASQVAAMPAVRQALLHLQREFAHQPGGAVLDGRDIGTVICPEADVKLFVTADVETRARRRLAQLGGTGEITELDDMIADLRRRDERDAGRADAPMKPADDAHLLDTTDLDIEAAFRAALAIVEDAGARKADTRD
ncbi:(d)CMP kinase [Cucumibacter marinus]|jgi:cytidylate kinase|uniref:(d)CMP kinase n=1 Tax=Cucumibacter marinus TaxID=1121252 RepID=UPI000415F444|nr:(d)CMP kinase [Cucumibacter marinus]